MTIIPRSFEPHKIVEVWNKYNFFNSYLSSFVQLIGEWFFCILFNGLAGYVLSRLRPRGSNLVFREM